MISVAYIALGGAIGSILRYLTSLIFNSFFPNFPFGTLFVNLLGSFLIGLIISNLENQNSFDLFIKYFLIIGLLGSFTTFSAFSIEVIQLLNDKKIILCLLYIFLSIFLSILGAGLGYFINRF